jgi:hypothetical protein
MKTRRKMTERRRGYLEYIDSEHWAHLRREKLAEISSCQICETSENLHVHHVNYRDYYSCVMGDLVVLCRSCHDSLHVALRRVGGYPDQFPLPLIKELLARYYAGELGKCRVRDFTGKSKSSERREKIRVQSKKRHFRKQVARMIDSFWHSPRTVYDVKRLRDGLSEFIDSQQDSLVKLILEHDSDPF